MRNSERWLLLILLTSFACYGDDDAIKNTVKNEAFDSIVLQDAVVSVEEPLPALNEEDMVPGAHKILRQRSLPLNHEALLYSVNGYEVPTLDAFIGWVILNHAQGDLKLIQQYFKDKGVRGFMPLYLVLLQGTDWHHKGTSIFFYPPKKYWDNMVNTLLFIEKEVIPVVGELIPVSGERSKYYNQTSGGASRSKHLTFCALDLTPATKMTRKELHQRLSSVFSKVGKKYNMGLGLYSGLRFHIDTCGYRRW